MPPIRRGSDTVQPDWLDSLPWPQEKRPRSRPLEFFLLGLLALIAIVILSGALLLLDYPEPAAAAIEDGNTLAVYASGGRILWRRELHGTVLPGHGEKPLVQFADLDGDGAAEVLVALRPDSRAAGAYDRILCFGPTGDLLWEFAPGREVEWGGFAYPRIYSLWGFTAGGRYAEGGRYVAVVANHDVYSPSHVVILDALGRVTGEYWHTGWIHDHALMDLNEDGEDEIVLGGVTETHHRAFLALIGPRIPRSISPVDDGYAPAFDRGRELAYALFPETSVSRSLDLASRVSEIRVVEHGHLFVRLRMAGNPGVWERLYYLDCSFKTLRMDLAPDYLARRRELQREQRIEEEEASEKQRLMTLERAPLGP